MRVFLLLAVLIVLTGCAALDTSMLETAETIKPGSFRVGTYAVSAPNLSGVFNLDERYQMTEGDDNGDEDRLLMPVAGVRASAGITKQLELFATASLQNTYRMGLKYKLPGSDSKTMISILPTIIMHNSYNSYSSDTFKSKLIIKEPQKETYDFVGYEFPVLYTRKVKPGFTVTLGAKATYCSVHYTFRYIETIIENFISDEYDISVKRREDLFAGSAVANVQIDSKYVYLTPAIGLSYIYTDKGYQGLIPNVGLGVGIQFYPNTRLIDTN